MVEALKLRVEKLKRYNKHEGSVVNPAVNAGPDGTSGVSPAAGGVGGAAAVVAAAGVDAVVALEKPGTIGDDGTIHADETGTDDVTAIPAEPEPVEEGKKEI